MLRNEGQRGDHGQPLQAVHTCVLVCGLECFRRASRRRNVAVVVVVIVTVVVIIANLS